MKKFIPFSVIALVMLALVMAFQPDIKPAAATPVEEVGSASVVKAARYVMLNDNLVNISKFTSWSQYEAVGFELNVPVPCATADGLLLPDCRVTGAEGPDCQGNVAIRKSGSDCCSISGSRPPHFAGGYCYECVSYGTPPPPSCVDCWGFQESTEPDSASVN